MIYTYLDPAEARLILMLAAQVAQSENPRRDDVRDTARAVVERLAPYVQLSSN